MTSRWATMAICLAMGCGSGSGGGGTSPAPPAGTGGEAANATGATPPPGSFGDDVAFLRSHLPRLVVLARGDAQVAVAPEYQGRVMTTTSGGDAGPSFGWINRELIASGERRPHMNAFGGEDRFWIGPEAGQYGLYFPPGAPFDLASWQVPEPIDWGGWEIASQSDDTVAFRRDMQLTNYSRANFSIRVDRTVRLLGDEAMAAIGAAGDGVQGVAYESVNRIENTGEAAWRPETGLVSVWILSMYQPSAATTVVIPFRPGPEAELGPVVNDAYFGQVPADRLVVDAERGLLYFSADGQRRSKIGVSHRRARPVMGSWDSDGGTLTLVQYTLPEEAPHGYVNSMWEHQEDPYAGDVVNSYNDGPPAPGAAPLGPFYELESSSPAAALAPGASLEHVHRTFHLQGSREALDGIARAQLGVDLATIEAALP